ncbi:MAG: hypothetical protein PHT33_10170 [bacterium]|nr:hypothetical protein [bacterium]
MSGTITDYFSPPHSYIIAVRPLFLSQETSSFPESVDDYHIKGYGKGKRALRRVLARILEHHLNTPVSWDPDLWNKTVLLTVCCELLSRDSGETFDVLKPSSIKDISPEFHASEGFIRRFEANKYAKLMIDGKALPPPLYVTGAVLNLLGGKLHPMELVMADGARRLTAAALCHKRTIPVNLLVCQDEYERFFKEQAGAESSSKVSMSAMH